MLLVLLVATPLRFAQLSDLPVGLHYDEAANGILAAEIASGVRTPIFISSYTGKEVLFFYWAAAWMRILGPSVFALRLSSACIGVCTVVAAAWAAFELLPWRRGAPWIAVLTAAFVATSFWHLVLSRYGFRAGTQPLLQALTVAALWRGLRLRHRGWIVLAGLACGATAYTYLAARAFPIPLACALGALLVADRGSRRQRIVHVLLLALAALAVLAPLLVFFVRNPGSFATRMEQVAAGSLGEAADGIISALGMLIFEGDPYVRFNYPGRPVFDLVTGLLFLHGGLVVLTNLGGQHDSEGGGEEGSELALSRSSRVFLFANLLVMLLPSALATGDITPSNLRAVGLLPFVYVFPAVSLESLGTKLSTSFRQIRPSPDAWGFRLVMITLVVLTPLVAWLYFGLWASSPDLYYEADGVLVDVARFLDDADLAGLTPYVGSRHYRHPTLALASESFPTVKWLVGGNTLVVPSEDEGLVVLPRGADDALEWAEDRVLGWSLLAEQLGPDGATAFRVYRVPAGASFRGAQPAEADFGRLVSLRGYELVSSPRSGGVVEGLFHWHVDRYAEQADLVPVARLADSWGGVWGETRPFHYPSEQWEPGELWLDHMSVSVAPGAPPGDYMIQLGFYAQSDGTILPVLDESGAYAGLAAEIPVGIGRAAVQPDVDTLGIRTPVEGVSAGGLTLLGANLDTISILAGEPVYLTLFWQAEWGSLQDLDVRVSLGDAVLYEGPPVHGTYPTTVWVAGEIVADRHDARVARDEQSGSYPVQVELVGQAGESLLGPVHLGEVAVQATEREFETPPLQHPIGVPLGDCVVLLGYDLRVEPSANQLIVTLYWEAVTEMDISFSVFNHLLGPGGQIIAQHDGVPVDGAYPTTLWVADEIVADRHVMDLPADLPAGTYEWELGMYVAETGDRLAVPGSPDGAIHLQVVYQP